MYPDHRPLENLAAFALAFAAGMAATAALGWYVEWIRKQALATRDPA